jgi:endoglucanase
MSDNGAAQGNSEGSSASGGVSSTTLNNSSATTDAVSNTSNATSDGTGGSSTNAMEASASTTGSSTTGSPGAGWLETEGNKIVYASDGSVFRGRGANMHETRSCNACSWSEPNVGEVKRRIDTLVDGWGANFMRLLIESYDGSDGQVHYRDPSDDAEYLADIVEIVDHIGSKPGVYVLVSLWIDPSFSDLGWPTDETTGVWEVVADALIDRPHVLFGLVNEPESNYDGAQDAEVWQAMNDTVAGIRAVEQARGAPQHIIAVQGTRAWARNLEYYVDNPITAAGGTNIAYETHSYLTTAEFDEIWANPSDALPVIIGEFGPADLGGGTEMTLEDATNMMDEAERRDIPWLAWTFHMRCAPNLLVDNSVDGCGGGMDLEPTAWGQHIMDRLSMPWLSGP